jgi:hypothetical protein
MLTKLSFLPDHFLFNRKIRLGSFAVTAVLLSGCASMAEQECLTANWLDQGFRDGRNGYGLSRIEDHRQACAKVGVRPDDALYFEGRDQGILYYCTPENAVQEGRKGAQYRNACPAHLEHEFLVSYEKGREIHDAEQRLEKLNREASQLEKALSDEDDADERRQLRRELRDIDRESQRARSDIRYLERQLLD